MVKVKQAIVVEGKYDKNTLSQLVDAPIFETSGFGVMNDKTMLRFLRRVAEQRGLIILTDSDGAGFVIRNYLKGVLPKDKVLHAYIPDIYGKEKRKTSPGKEGKLGVEGMTQEVLLTALKNAGAELDGAEAPKTETITKQDFYSLGLSGTACSKANRQRLLKRLELPEHMSSNALLEAVNILFSRSAFYEQMERIQETDYD